jgi:hypothetical protein
VRRNLPPIYAALPFFSFFGWEAKGLLLMQVVAAAMVTSASETLPKGKLGSGGSAWQFGDCWSNEITTKFSKSDGRAMAASY